MQQNLSSPSYLCSELVSIATPTSQVPGNLEAIDQWSAVLLAEQPLKRRTEVRIQLRNHTLKGTVKSCAVDPLLGCFVEVRLKPESAWSKKWFKPQHLLALRDQMPAIAKKCA